jgi:hypothetical protein
MTLGMRKTIILAITCSFFDHFGSSWACFHQKIGLIVWLCSNRSQLVITGPVALSKGQQLQLQLQLLPVGVGLGCSFFAVVATGPHKTSQHNLPSIVVFNAYLKKVFEISCCHVFHC